MHSHLLKVGQFMVLLSLFTSTLLAQNANSLSSKYPKNSKVLYKTIKVQKDLGKVIVTIDDSQEFQYDHWEGDAILVEQKIHMENAPKSVFNELVRRDRYTLKEQLQTNTLYLKYAQNVHKDLMVNYKDMNEKVFIKLLVPEKVGVELKRKS